MKYCYFLFLMIIPVLSVSLHGSDTLNISGMKIDSSGNGEEFVKNPLFIKANHPYLQYTGRFDYSNPDKPRCWAPGTYLRVQTAGEICKFLINDEEPGGEKNNYLAVIIDKNPPMRIRLKGKSNILDLSDKLNNGKHIITICKNTEANIGYIEFAGLICDSLLPPPEQPVRKMEFIGNSITCGTGADTSEIPCGARDWHDQHNAYMSYGPLTARNFNAQWHLTAVSGIGLIHSCCENDFIITDVYDKISLLKNTAEWDFSSYIPDVVTICLGQNDGIQDSVEFTHAYIDFIGKLRAHYSDAEIICLLSPMANQELRDVQTNYITAVVDALNAEGDSKVHKYFFKKIYNGGCDWHPSLEEHGEIAGELEEFLRSIPE